ncbi:MAG: hypothetical protein OXD42_08910 [Rhodospirillaceae bacterium]|nr:hypothetical protein [Rhodospirillaceae bacterium]MCY4239311.1 hypothetical protein [Rhodospirillaceae bacterium]
MAEADMVTQRPAGLHSKPIGANVQSMETVTVFSHHACWPLLGARRHIIVMMSAAGIGGVIGGFFSTDLVQAASVIWSNHILPAYFELLLSGIPFCA